MRMRLGIWSMIAVVGLSAYPLSARAGQVIVSNLNQTPDPFTSQIDPSFTWAQEFTTGGSFTLLNVFASLGDLNPGNNGDFTVTAQLFSVVNAGDTPNLGTVVANFAPNTASIPMSSPAPVEFDPTSSTVSLSGSSFYWFVLSGASSDGTGSVQWQFADTFNTDPGSVPGSSLPNIANLVGGGWTLLNPPATPFLIEVNAVGGAVPEPSSLVMGCAGFAAVLFARRRIPSRRSA
jgi:hypothetical protein